MKGRGVSTSKGTGDLLAVLHVAVPSHLSSGAREALEAYAAAEPDEDPREDILEKARY